MADAGTIADRVNELHAGMAGHVPDEVLAINARDRAELAASGTPDSAAIAGSVLADADLLDVNGASTTLYAATGEAPAVVVFYRGAWCPYCNVALRTYQEQLLPELTRRGFAMIAVSPQTPDGSLSMQEKNELTFTVVSDPGNTLAPELGILTAPSEQGQGCSAETRPRYHQGQRGRNCRAPDALHADPGRHARRTLDRRPPGLQHPIRARADSRRHPGRRARSRFPAVITEGCSHERTTWSSGDA